MTRTSLGVVVAVFFAGCSGSGNDVPTAPSRTAGTSSTSMPAPTGGPDATTGATSVNGGADGGNMGSAEGSTGTTGSAPATDSSVDGGTRSEVDSSVAAQTDAGGAHNPDTGVPIPPTGDGGVGWDTVPSILARIVPPTFPNLDCDITNPTYGGKGDGTTDNTTAFSLAIADCASKGGGRVVVPALPAPATYVTGAIVLKSNINLYVAAGATISFSVDPMKYLPVVETSFEGSLLYNYKPLVSAHDETNIAITGGGTLDGNATMTDWYAFSAKQHADSVNLRTQNATALPVMQRMYGQGHFLRPSLIEFMRCTNILLDGFTAARSPFWTIHPVMCKNVTGHNVTSIGTVGNTDGFDPESCVDVHLDGLKITVGDDPIAIKAGRDVDGRTLYGPTENVVIENCTFGSNNSGHGASIAIGSEMSGGVRNVYAQNITFHDHGQDPNVPGVLAQAIYLKASIYRGGYIKDFYARQLQVDSISTLFFLNGQYSTAAADLPQPPVVQPILFTEFSNINVDGATVKSVTSEAFRIEGPDTSRPATGIDIRNVTVTQGSAVSATPAHYTGLKMTNVSVNGTPLTLPASAP